VGCANLAEAGDIEQARCLMGKLRQLHPGISHLLVEQWVLYTAERTQHFLKGLRQAGLPEK